MIALVITIAAFAAALLLVSLYIVYFAEGADRKSGALLPFGAALVLLGCDAVILAVWGLYELTKFLLG